eukprot:scaffold97866_cov61-Phaeocystis_antarctica.AAC.1
MSSGGLGGGDAGGPIALQTASHGASSRSESRRTPFVRPRRAWRGGERPAESREAGTSHKRRRM